MVASLPSPLQLGLVGGDGYVDVALGERVAVDSVVGVRHGERCEALDREVEGRGPGGATTSKPEAGEPSGCSVCAQGICFRQLNTNACTHGQLTQR